MRGCQNWLRMEENLSIIFTTMMKNFKSCFNVLPLDMSYQKISQWFASPLGRRLMICEREAIAEKIRYLFGYHFMQLSSVRSANFTSLSRINHCFSVAPCYDGEEDRSGIQGVANFDDLPIDNDMLDVTVLHHVLEFSENPHQVLKEAARVTIPRGYIIIVAFNPLSAAGIFQALGALFNDSGISRRRTLRAGRMRDWLEFLDFSCVNTSNVFHNLPINNARYLASTQFVEKLGFNNKMPGGMSFVIVARKDKVGLTPIKPKWEKASLLDAMPIAKQAIRAKTSEECMVLPFRTRGTSD